MSGFIERNYVPVLPQSGLIYVAGQTLGPANAGVGVAFDVRVPADYAIVTPHGSASGILDGAELSGARHLVGGHHVFVPVRRQRTCGSLGAGAAAWPSVRRIVSGDRSMTRNLRFQATDRLLVFAPHPDDETLATGEMIQFAMAAGAKVRVVFATDGDNNPWPQRWCERRWHIGLAERQRWGQRRRGEAVAALAHLGVSADAARFLGWPDLGLTEKLMRDDRAIEMLAAEINDYAPTHVAMPSLRDRHPDHGALRVMLELALRRSRTQCLCFGYVVHGRSNDSGEWELARDAQRHSRKREALTEHASQIALSKRRLLRWASQNESFEQAEPRGANAIGAAAIDALMIPLLPHYRFLRRHDVVLVLADGPNIERACVRLPRWVQRGESRVLGFGLCSGRAAIEIIDGALRITFAGGVRDAVSGYVKIERSAPRVLIFDRQTWHRVEDFAAAPESAASHVEPVAAVQRASF